MFETKMEEDRYTLKHNYSVKESRDLMEWLINEKLTEWQIYNIDPSSDNYITEAGMHECITYIIKGIMLEMTPVQLDILSVGFPMDNQDNQIDSIKNRAKLAVLNYSVKQNTPKESNEIIENINAF